MARTYFTERPHQAVLEEHEYVYISGDGREVVKEAETITYQAALPRWKKAAGFVFDALSKSGETFARMHGAGHLYDYSKHDEDELNANQ